MNAEDAGIASQLLNAILDAIGGEIPKSNEAKSKTPHARSWEIAQQAAKTAAVISGSAALVPGGAGILTLIPQMIAVGKVHAQMVADIAAAHGKTASLTKNGMLGCLFRHTCAHALRDGLTGAFVRHSSPAVMQKFVTSIGIGVTQRAVGNAIARWVPVLGALGVAAYAFYDTQQVATTAIELFGGSSMPYLDE